MRQLHYVHHRTNFLFHDAAVLARSVRSAAPHDGSSSRREATESSPRGDGFAAFMRAHNGRVRRAADPADARRQLSAEWLQLTVGERREWRRRDAQHGSASAGSRHGSTPPRSARRLSPRHSSRPKHVRCAFLFYFTAAPPPDLAERCFGFSHDGIGQSARRSATEEPQTPASATSSATTTPVAAPAVWNGRGSHLTPRGDGDNALKEGDLEQSMMAAATAAKVKRGKQRPKSAAVLANTRDWSAHTSPPGLPATQWLNLLLWWQERGRCPCASRTGLRLRREHAH